MKARNMSILHVGAIRPGFFILVAPLLLLMSGCTSLSVESARTLGAVGKEVSMQSAGNAYVSNDEYQRAMDAEAFFHGFTDMRVPPQLSDDYKIIQAELGARKIVFSRLGDVYDAFSNLAAIDAVTTTEAAINGLGDSINGYAAVRKMKPVISGKVKGAIAQIGALGIGEMQKEKIKRSSVLIRERLIAFSELLMDPLVRTQMIGFKQNLAQNRASAIRILWGKGVFDPSPLIDQLGTDAGLKASKEVAQIVNNPKDTTIRDGLNGIIVTRLNRRIDLIEQGYDSSASAMKELIKKHEELESGEELSLARLRQIIAEFHRIAELLAPTAASSKAK